MSLDTLKYAEELEAGGHTKEEAHIHAVALNNAIDENVPTKTWLDKRFLEQSAEIRLLILEVIQPLEDRTLALEKRMTRVELLLGILVIWNGAVGSLVLGKLFELF